MQQTFSTSRQELYIPLDYQEIAKLSHPLEQISLNKQANQSIFPKPVSNHKEQYLSFFSQIEQQSDLLIRQALNNTDQKLYHNIVFLNNNKNISDLISFKKPAIYIIGHSYGATIITYQVIIGNYKISINLLNLNFQASYQKVIGEGGYGQIFVVNYTNGKYMVAKRLLFDDQKKIQINKDNIYANKKDIEEVICEYAIYNICSFYKIGPKIIHQFGFNLVCFDNCIEFYMEYCMTARKWHQKIQKWLKIALRTLHKLKIIHKDIKPQNLLYSVAYQKFVFIDFGISHSLEQQVGQMTKTYQQGTFSYMSPEMKEIKKDQMQYIDLYFNDVYGLKQILSMFAQWKESEQLKVNYSMKRQAFKPRKQNMYEIIHFFSEIVNHHQKQLAAYLFLLEDRFKQVELFFKRIMNSQIKNLLNEYETLSKLNLPFDVNANNQEKQKIFNLIRVYGLSQQLQEEIYFSTHNDLKNLIINKIKQSKQNRRDPKHQLNLAKLNKIAPVQLKLQREITELKYSQQSESQLLLQKYLELFFKKIRKSNASWVEVTDIYNKIVEQYKQRDKNDVYQFVVILFKLIQNPNVDFYTQILEVIHKYPSKELQLLEMLVIIYPFEQNTINCYLRLLQFYNSPQNISQNWKILNSITQYYHRQKQQTKFNFFFNKFQSSVNHYLNTSNGNYPSFIEIQINFYLGNFQNWQHNYESALKYYQKSELKQKLFNGQISLRRASILYKIGYIYFKILKYKEAQAKLKQCLDLFGLYCSYSMSHNSETYQCYYYLITMYFMKNNSQCFNYYLNLSIIETINIKTQKLVNHHFDQDSPVLEKSDIKNMVEQLELKRANNQITIQVYRQHQITLFNYFYVYKYKSSFANLLSKYVNPQNQHLLKQLVEQLQKIKPHLQLFYNLITRIFIQDHKKGNCCLDRFLQLQQINATISLNPQVLYELYQCIYRRYYFSRSFNKCQGYLIKQFKLMSNHKMTHLYRFWIQKVLELAKIIKRYNLIILLSWKQLSQHKIYQSVIYKNIIKYYMSRCQIKKAEMYHINYQKRKKWNLDSYFNSVQFYCLVKKMENSMIFLCYLNIYFKEYMKDKQNRVKRKQPYESICNAIFQQKQCNVYDKETPLKILKMSKKCLYLKMRIGCLKYLKAKNLKKKIKNLVSKLK